jgi:glycosyltransferase involved in cell wall biosynthesis
MRQITVAIPVFNAMPYLPESLDSILRQSYSDFEILVINDGSTDDSTEYLRSVRDPRLRVVDQEHRGLTATLNHLLAEVNTPWLARHDADDVAYPHRLAHAADHIRQFPESGMFYSLAEYYPPPSVGRFRTTKGSPSEIRALVESGYLVSICHPTVVLNVERTRELGGYRFDLHVEDIDLWWRMALHYDIRFIPEVATGYRQNVKSISAVNIEEQAFNTLYVQYLLISHLWNRRPMEYEEARNSLPHIFDPGKVKFRNHLRAFNIELGRGNKNRAVVRAARAFFSSPASFMRRLWDEYSSGRTITLGETPALIEKHANILWPDHAGNCPAAFGSQPPANRGSNGSRSKEINMGAPSPRP